MQTDNEANRRDEPTIVGIGASAGGLEALEAFFRNTPENSGLAYVVVQHLSPDFKSVMAELLARVTSIPIREIRNEMVAEANTIYLLPPKQEVICSEGRLLLSDRGAGRELHFPIDQFFRSLANDARSRSIAVVLSGTGTDGSRGICDIHESGGLVLVQDEESAKFNGMPRAALDTGIVDRVLPPDEMAEALIEFLGDPNSLALRQALESVQAMEGPMYTVFHLLKKHCGVDFSDYKTTTISRRIQRRVMLSGMASLEAYVGVLKENQNEVDRLYKDLLIGVTNFFRDSDVFEKLEQEVLPSIIERLDQEEELRIWVVGTATGEEAYSLGILVTEYLERLGLERLVKIFATDVHRDSLETASRGVYSEECLASLSSERLNRFFVRKADGYHVISELRKKIVFVGHNVVRDAPFTKLDLITCRNVMIYLTAEAQKKVLSLFHFTLKREAVLCLGPSETTGELANEFESVDDRAKIYRKHRELALQSIPRPPVHTPRVGVSRPRIENALLAKAVAPKDLLTTYDELLEELLPTSLLVGSNYELLHSFGGASRYLHHREGRPSTDVLELIHPDIRLSLSAALRRVERENHAVVFNGISCELDSGTEEIKLEVRPIGVGDGTPSTYLLAFESREQRQPPLVASEIDARSVSSEEVATLEKELQQMRDNLQSTIEQLQTTNEELQSSNEQLIASNEELQSTNEELHSVNEELYTVNAEHQRKIGELTELTDDMDNLLGSTNVHTIFLDAELRIRRFTPGIADTFNLIPQDVGRRIDTFTYNILDKDLVFEVKQVLETEVPFDREVRDRNDNWYLLRILPYVTSGRVDGVVLTLIEITSLKQAERKLAEMSEIVEHSDDAIVRISPDGVVTTWNRGAENLFGFPAHEVIGKEPSFLVPEDKQEQASNMLARALGGSSVDHFETQRRCRKGDCIDVSITLSPIRDLQGNVVGASEIVRDITAQKKAEAEVRAAVRHRDEFLAMLSHELRNPLAAVLNANTLLEENGLDEKTDLEARQVISRNVRHVARMLDDLLDLSRMTHDKLNLSKSVVNLSELTVDVFDCVQHMVEEKQQHLHVFEVAKDLFVEGDVGRIQQAQANLMVNACKYTPKKGRIEYSLYREGNFAVVRIRDNGVGMSAEFLEHAFEPFVQSIQTLDRSRGGMGLGLPLVRMIVEAHGGTIAAYSDGHQKGSTFTIRFPLTKKRPEKKPKPKSTRVKGCRLLLVEDNDGIRRMLARALELKGLDVRVARDGNEGLEQFIDFRPDVGLIDIGLPDVNGYELAKLIREKPAFEKTLLVAVTGYGRESDRKRALETGFDLHLIKPLDPNEVLSAVETHLDRRVEKQEKTSQTSETSR